MSDDLNFADGTASKLPSGLNVLTILTFIGSGLGLIFSAAYPWIINFSKSMMDKALASGQEMSAKQLEDIEKGRKAMELVQANLTPLVIVGVLASILCIVGAVMMRKLKKDGFWIYLGGELLPVIAGFVLMGTQQFTGVMSVIIGAAIPVLFIILYAMQRKHLVK